ncbi:Transcriptional regulator, GntR family [Arthrobacter sp. PAMC 25486]|uniref:FadR/GntR family transcriptional regulator n=1 Tax=Arthrobacter sp. PAMC 25486 TaxID=1494608 RepID=UPI000535C497|nr:FadR/GntR family transcriptional regulator [Arthrobacter sp. PAMC 25486]AIY01861.1 Transcriptional regulator, GntR family [Arthrobacter sp. PAMC 25486]
MSLTPSHREPLAQEVTGKLSHAISSGMWAVNERIPSEQELMKELGVSRGTLREAIKSLAHVGMLEVLRGDGTYVRATSEIAGATQKLIGRHGNQHVVEVRLALDTQAARLAALNATDAQKGEMRALLADRRRAWEAKDVAGWVAHDWEFHLAVARASANPLLAGLYESFGDVVRSDVAAHSGGQGDGCPQEGHEDLLAAIEARDPDAAFETAAENLGE